MKENKSLFLTIYCKRMIYHLSRVAVWAGIQLKADLEKNPVLTWCSSLMVSARWTQATSWENPPVHPVPVAGETSEIVLGCLDFSAGDLLKWQKFHLKMARSPLVPLHPKNVLCAQCNHIQPFKKSPSCLWRVWCPFQIHMTLPEFHSWKLFEFTPKDSVKATYWNSFKKKEGICCLSSTCMSGFSKLWWVDFTSMASMHWNWHLDQPKN